MARKTFPTPGTTLNTAPRNPGITMRRQAEMEAKAAEGPTENKSAKVPRKVAKKPAVKAAPRKTAKKTR